MMTLDDAWDWFLRAKRQLGLLNRIGRRHWSSIPWDASIGRDEKLKSIEAQDIVDDTNFCLDHLNDFAVLILFSSFESILRDRARLDIRNERKRLDHPLEARILDQAVEDIEQGSIFRVLGVFKAQDANLVEEVNQVRRYRNWVAHGRRGEPPSFVDPETAYGRLNRFLDRFTGPIPEEA
jgi:hypothetical protein